MTLAIQVACFAIWSNNLATITSWSWLTIETVTEFKLHTPD